MGSPRPAFIIAAAMAGLLMIAGLTYSASTLVSQPIGVSSEPSTLGASLAPAKSRGDVPPNPRAKSSPSTTTTNAPTTTATFTTPATTAAPVTSAPPPIGQPTVTGQPHFDDTSVQHANDD